MRNKYKYWWRGAYFVLSLRITLGRPRVTARRSMDRATRDGSLDFRGDSLLRRVVDDRDAFDDAALGCAFERETNRPNLSRNRRAKQRLPFGWGMYLREVHLEKLLRPEGHALLFQ